VFRSWVSIRWTDRDRVLPDWPRRWRARIAFLDESSMTLYSRTPKVSKEILSREFREPHLQTADDLADGWSYSVGRAWRIVNSWNPEKRKGRLRLLLVNEDLPHQRKACGRIDLSIPVLIGQRSNKFFLLDGRHRYRKARRQRLTSLPCFLLSAADTRSVGRRLQAQRISPLLKVLLPRP